MSRDFIKGIIVGAVGLWTVAINKAWIAEVKENKKLKEIIKNKEEA